jgi:phage/plasmid-associated DNA primase
MRAQFKYGQPFSFVNRAKLIFSANRIPDSDDTVKAFLADMCCIDLGAPEYLIRTGELYDEYRKYSRHKKERPLDANIFGIELKKEGIERDRLRNNGPREYYYLGVQLLSYLRGQNQSLL